MMTMETSHCRESQRGKIVPEGLLQCGTCSREEEELGRHVAINEGDS